MIGNTLYKKNLEVIKEQLPQLHDALEKTDTSNMKVTVDEYNINIRIDDQPLYPANSSEYLGNKIEEFFSAPGAFYKNPPILKKEPGIADINDYYIEKLIEKYDVHNLPKIQYDQYLDSVPILVMFGIGTGQQIEQLISLVDIKTLILVDTDYKMLKTSMHIIDWEPILRYFARPNYNLQIFTSDGAFSLAASVLNHVYKLKTYLAYYVNYFYTYKTPFFEEVNKNIKEHYFNILTGWGFYDDEILSLKHTLANIQYGCSVFNKNQLLDENSKVFIIGSGPSIDNDIEYIKKVQDDVVLFSCGTALRILEKNGIVPDYHFEIERTKITFDIISNSVSKEFMKKVNFIGLNVIYPEVFDLFKTDKLFFRDFDCGSSIIPFEIPFVDDCNPTVLNGAFAFASEAGFKNIYLFGADMGYKDESNHHSKDTIYGDKNHEKASWKPNTARTLPGNFDQNTLISSTDILSWCKQRVENCIKNNIELFSRNINYFNCSDGAYIYGAKPCKSSEIVITDSNKQKDIDQLESSFIYFNKELLEESLEKFNDEKSKFLTTINTIITIIENKQVSTYSELLDILDNIYIKFGRVEGRVNNNSFVYSLLRGSTVHIFTYIYAYALNAPSMTKSFEYIKYGLDIYKEFLISVKDDINTVN